MTSSNCFFSNHSKLHMFDLNPHKVEINFPFHNISQMKDILLVFKLNMKTFLYPNLELYRRRGFWRSAVLRILDQKDLFLLDLPIVSSDCDFDHVFQTTLDTLVRFICFLNILEVKVISHIIAQCSWRFEFSR